MNTPEAPKRFRTRVREYLRELAFDLLAVHHRLFDPFDPKSMPDYSKEIACDYEDKDAGSMHQPQRHP